MFGMMEAMLSFLRRQVGLRTDSADPDGSLHAKVKEVRAVAASTNANVSRAPWAAGKTPVWLYGKYNTKVPMGTTVTVLTLTGPRIILGGFIVTNVGQSGSETITIDGVSHTIGKYSYDGSGDGFFAREILGTSSNIFQDFEFKGMADYRFFTQYVRQFEYTVIDCLKGGGIFTLPMMYINSGLSVKLTAPSSGTNETKVIWNIFHTSV